MVYKDTLDFSGIQIHVNYFNVATYGGKKWLYKNIDVHRINCNNLIVSWLSFNLKTPDSEKTLASLGDL